MKKKRILFILDHIYGGGAETITLNLAAALGAEHQVGLIILDKNNSKLKIPENIDLINVTNDSKFINSNFWRMKNFSEEYKQNIQHKVDAYQADLVIISFWNSLHLSTFLQHPNVYYWIHGDIFYQPRAKSSKYILRNFFRSLKKPLFLRKLLNSQNIIVVNHDLNRKISKICKQSKVHTLYNGIQSNCINKEKQICWDAIYVGRLSSEKQVDHAIKAFSQSKLTGKMAIVGDGYLKEHIIQLIEELKLKDRVFLLGWLSPAQVAQQIYSSKLLILSSETEGYPLVVSEAIMLGTPVASYKCCEGISHQLSNNLSIGLAEAQKITSLADAIDRVAAANICITNENKRNLCLNTMKDRFEKLTGL